MKKLVLGFIIWQILGCSDQTASKAKNSNNLTQVPPAIAKETYPEKPLTKYKDNGDDVGDGDFDLSIVAISETDSMIVYNTLSSWQNKNLGLMVEIPKNESEKGY